MRWRLGSAVLAVGLGLAGCGSGGHATTGTPPRVTNPSSSARSVLAPFLLATGEEAGFPPNAKATNYTSAANWAAFGQTSGGASRLKAEGFVDAVIESIGNDTDGSGSSFVTEFSNPAGARAEAAAQLQAAIAAASAGTRSFTVPGVSSAKGIVIGSVAPVGTNVFWVQGRCLMGLGNSTATSQQSAIVAAVQAIYRRTHGRCP